MLYTILNLKANAKIDFFNMAQIPKVDLDSFSSTIHVISDIYIYQKIFFNKYF